jgi:Sporulation and spore germination
MLRRSVIVLVFALIGILPIETSVRAQATATKFRIDNPEYRGGQLYITVGGKQRKIYDEAWAAWIINDGRDVVFSGPDGAGGFENEGQSLRIYNVASRSMRKILSESVMVVALKAVKTKSGAVALLVRMEDGGLGGSYFAVVDPKRGEVFYRQWAELKSISGDNLTLGFFHEEDFEKMITERDSGALPLDQVFSITKVRPYKTEQHSLTSILKGKVIYNRPTFSESGDESLTKARDVKVFAWDANSKAANFKLVPVSRRVTAAAPLRPTLQMLFAGLTDEEKAQGLSNSTFGMKFEDLKFQHGAALVKFSQPLNETNYGSQGPIIFAEAIEKTARQFPAVRQVKICAVGETLIDAQLEKPFPKCPK